MKSLNKWYTLLKDFDTFWKSVIMQAFMSSTSFHFSISLPFP